jgi:hypothetical protein
MARLKRGWTRRFRLGRAAAPSLALLTLSVSASFVLSPVKAEACPNDAFRTGPSATLPECRAYELVTPADSSGRRFSDLSSEPSLYDLFTNELASPLRDSFLFTSQGSALRTPGRGNGTLVGDVYQTLRTSSGWRVVRHVTPTGDEALSPMVGGASEDHSYNFVFVGELFGGSNGSLGDQKDYLGDPTGHYELTGIGSLGSEPFAQGRYISAGGEHVIFSTGHNTIESGWCGADELCRISNTFVKKLEPEAPASGTGVVYDRSADGPTHVVSLLPGDVTPADGENAIYQGASADGSTVAFKIDGTLYVRIDNARTVDIAGGDPKFGGLSADGRYLFYVIGGDVHRVDFATEEDEEVNASGDGKMVNAAADGSALYFVSPQALTGDEKNANGEEAVSDAAGTGDLSAGTGTGVLEAGSTLVTSVSVSEGALAEGMQINGAGIPEGAAITKVDAGTITLSDAATSSGTTTLSAGSNLITGVDTNRGAFRTGMEIFGEGIQARTTITGVSPAGIMLSTGVTKAGTVALTGAFPNLYVWSGTAPRYVATIEPGDVTGNISLTAWVGQVVAPIDESGRGPGADPSRTSRDGRVLVFESRAKLTSYANAGHTEIYRYDDKDKSLRCISCSPLATPAASDARLGDYGTLRRTTFIHNVSDDGKRIFFETAEALVPADSDGINDIYEWRQPDADTPPVLDLISSGKSVAYPQNPQVTPPRPNLLLGVTPDGSNVFFLAQDALVAGAPGGGTSAIYDARVNGGFAPPAPMAVPCLEWRECQGEGRTLPPVPTALSLTLGGSGNVKPRKRHRCSGRHGRSSKKRHPCHKKKNNGRR